MKIKKFSAFVLTMMFVLSSISAMASAEEAALPSGTAAVTEAASSTTSAVTEVPTPTDAADPYSGIGCYMAFFQIQTTSWVYRNNFDADETGYGSEIFKTVYNNETSTATSTVINDTVIDGDGEYTISLNNISLEGSTDFHMVAISTNIPLDSGIQITAATLKYGSREITSNFVQKNDNKKYVHIMLINQWDNAMKDTVNTMVPPDGSDMTITFMVSGFGYAKTAAEPTAAPTPTVMASAPGSEASSSKDSAVETMNNSETANETEDNDSLPAGAIAAIIVGAAMVAIIIVIVAVFKKSKKA